MGSDLYASLRKKYRNKYTYKTLIGLFHLFAQKSYLNGLLPIWHVGSSADFINYAIFGSGFSGFYFVGAKLCRGQGPFPLTWDVAVNIV